MQKLIILRGAPASGKSTIAKSYRNFENKVAWLKVDTFKDFFAEDATSALGYVNGCAIATLKYLLEQKFSVVMDGIFQDNSAIDEAIKVAQELNISTKVFQLEISLEILTNRDKTREGVKEGQRSALPEETIKKIYQRLEQTKYPGAIFINTEQNSIEKCIKLINSSFE